MFNVIFVLLLLVLSIIIYEKTRRIKNLEGLENNGDIKNILWLLISFFIFFVAYILYKFSMAVTILIMIYMFFSLIWTIFLLYKKGVNKESILKNWKMISTWFFTVNIVGISYMALSLFLYMNF